MYKEILLEACLEFMGVRLKHDSSLPKKTKVKDLVQRLDFFLLSVAAFAEFSKFLEDVRAAFASAPHLLLLDFAVLMDRSEWARHPRRGKPLPTTWPGATSVSVIDAETLRIFPVP